MFIRKKLSTLFEDFEDKITKKITELDTTIAEVNNNISEIQKQTNKLNEINQKTINAYDEINKLNEKLNVLNEKVLEIERRNIELETHLYKINKFEYCNPEYLQLNRTINDKKKVLLVGFYGAYNLGDELMLQTLLNKFSKYKNVELTVMLANNSNYNIFSYNKIKFIHYPQTRFDYEYLSDYYDCFVYGGGALLDDEQYNVMFQNEISLSTTIIELSQKAQEKNKETYFIGLSTNKILKNKKYIEKLNNIIKNATYFSLRDKKGLKVLEKNNICTSKVEIIDDIVLSNDIRVSKFKNKRNTLNIGIILIGIDVNIMDFNEKMIRELISNLEKRKIKYNINLIPFYNFNSCDNNYFLQLKRKLENDNILIKEYVNTLSEICEILDYQDCIISERYHGSLLSLFMNKNTLTLINDYNSHYVNKMNYLYEEYGFPANTLTISKSDTKALKNSLDKLLEMKKWNIETKTILDRNKNKIDVIFNKLCKK